MSVGALAAEVAQLNVFLGVVPGPAGAGHHYGQHEPGSDRSDEHSSQGSLAEDEPGGNGGENRHDSGGDHLPQSATGADVHASGGIRLGSPLHQAGDFPELTADFINYSLGSPAHRLHGESRENEGQHGPDDEAHQDWRAEEVDALASGGQPAVFGGELNEVSTHRICSQQRQGSQSSGTDGKTLAGGRRCVTQGVKGIGPFPHLGIQIGLFRDSASVVSHRAVGVGGQGDSESGKQADSRKGHPVEPGEPVGQ